MAASSEVVELPGEFYKNKLSDVMKREFKDFTTIVTAASGKGENFNGLLYRITGEGVKKDDDTNTSQLSLVLKIPIQIPSLREKWPVNIIYRKEVYIYNVILPELYLLQDSFAMPESERFRAAKCYSAGDEEFEEYLLMEDLCVSGYKLSNRRVSLSYRQMQLILKTLASFHALSFVLKKLKPEKFIEFSTYLNDLQAFPPELMGFVIVAQSRALSVLDDPVLLEKATNYGSPDIVQKLMELMDPKNVNPYSVICHGDCWNNNLLFKSEEDEPVDIMLLDWQISRNCSPITDIAYLIFSSTDYDLRKEHFKDLMDHYHSCLAKSLSYMDCDVEDHFPKAVFEDHLKKILPYGLFMSFMLLPAVLGEAEDVPDMDELLKKEKLGVNDLKFENKQSSNRYNIRMNGVVRTLVELDLI